MEQPGIHKFSENLKAFVFRHLNISHEVKGIQMNFKIPIEKLAMYFKYINFNLNNIKIINSLLHKI